MNQVRIIGGQWKRRLIHFAAIDGLRPTPDRIRETLFNWLMWDINSTTCVLDLCAGSGVLAFEALSRGAQQATLIEPDIQQVVYLKKNWQTLNADNTQVKAQIIQKTAQQALPLLAKTHPHAFDLVFLDPPYALDLWQDLALLVKPLLAPHARIYVEADQPLEQLHLPKDWQLIKQTKAGSIRAGLFEVRKSGVIGQLCCSMDDI